MLILSADKPNQISSFGYTVYTDEWLTSDSGEIKVNLYKRMIRLQLNCTQIKMDYLLQVQELLIVMEVSHLLHGLTV